MVCCFEDINECGKETCSHCILLHTGVSVTKYRHKQPTGWETENSTLMLWTGRFSSSWTGCDNLLSVLWRKGRSYSPRTRQYLLPTLHFSTNALNNRASHLLLPIYCGSKKSHSYYLVSHFCLTLPSGSEYIQPSVDSPWVWPPISVTWPKPCPTHFDPGDEGSLFAEL